MIPETEICRKHVKKCSGSVENAATETWETVMYPLTETRVCRCVSTMFKFTDTWFFVLWCNKPASWPFNVRPSVEKKNLLSQSLEWYLHCVMLATFAREPRKQKQPLFKQTHKVTFHIITSLGVVFSLSTLISKLSRAKIIGSFKLQVSLWLADLIGIS